MSSELPQIPISTHSFQQRYLFAFATQAELAHHIRTQALEEERNRLNAIMETWQALQDRVAQLVQRESGLQDSIKISPLPDEHKHKISSFVTDSLLQKTFQNLPISVELVEIDKLVAAQRNVNLDYVEKLCKQYSQSLGLSDLLDICVSPKRSMDPIQHLEVGPSTHIFSSPNYDVRFLGAFEKTLTPDDLNYAVGGGLPVAAIIAFVGYGGAPINVLKAGKRLVLNNGFHRVYALRSLGITEIPVVVQHVRNTQLEFPAAVSGLPREYLLGSLRPVLMKDFFESDFAITLKVRERLRTVTIAVNTGQGDIPT